jgi:hypothetical protein
LVGISGPRLGRHVGDLAVGTPLVVKSDARGSDYSSIGGRHLRIVVGHASDHLPILTDADHIAVVVRAEKRTVLSLQRRVDGRRSTSRIRDIGIHGRCKTVSGSS